MKITVHCEGTPAEIGTQLAEAAQVYNGVVLGKVRKAKAAEDLKQGEALVEEDDEETSAISIAEIKAKRGKKGKKAAEPEVEEDEADEEDEEVEADDESEDDDSEDGEDFDEESEDEEESLSDSDLTKLKAALKAHSAKNEKKKTVAILQKFAPKSDLVKTADLPKLLKLLKV